MLLNKRYNWLRRLGVVLLVTGCVSMFMTVEAKEKTVALTSLAAPSVSVKPTTPSKNTSTKAGTTANASKASTSGSYSKTNKVAAQKSNKQSKTFTVNGVSFEMVYVEGGSFMMGSNDNSWEQPVHSETVGNFFIGQTEVTQEQWEAVMGNNPSKFKGDQRPVENVSWNDCQEFIRKLNALTGQNFRLPTEAEWEYAARGGKYSRGYEYSGSNNIKEVAWYDDNSNGGTHTVATKAPNELGLYDMSGNVWEWTSDLWSDNYNSARNGGSSGSFRVNRGGGWRNIALYCRLALRFNYFPDYKSSNLGLRLAM